MFNVSPADCFFTRRVPNRSTYCAGRGQRVHAIGQQANGYESTGPADHRNDVGIHQTLVSLSICRCERRAECGYFNAKLALGREHQSANVTSPCRLAGIRIENATARSAPPVSIRTRLRRNAVARLPLPDNAIHIE